MASKVDISNNDLVEMIRSGQLRLPEMQRRYVWRATRVRDLIDSLYRGYPSGSILVWETDQAMPTVDMAVEQKVSPFAGHKLLLDGQQRATSLSARERQAPGSRFTRRPRLSPAEPSPCRPGPTTCHLGISASRHLAIGGHRAHYDRRTTMIHGSRALSLVSRR